MSRAEWAVIINPIVGGGDTDPGDLDARILSWEYEDEETKADKLVVRLDNHDLSQFEAPEWEKGVQLLVSYGYIGRQAPARRMVVRKLSGGLELEVTAHAASFLLDTQARTRTFRDMTRSQVVAVIADDNGYGPGARNIADTTTVFDRIQQARRTDAEFLRQLARKEGFEFWIDHRGLTFAPRDVGQRPLLSIGCNGAEGDVPALSWNITNDVSRQPSKVIVRGRDRLAKKDFQFELDTVAGIERTLARAADVPPVSPVRTAIGQAASAIVTVLMADEDTEAAARRAIEGRLARRRQETVKLEVELVGEPLLFAGSVVQVNGLGPRMSGNYYVKKAKHSGSSSGYTTSATLLRDGKAELRDPARLFFGGFTPGRGSGPCAAAIASVREAVTKLVGARNENVAAAAASGISIRALTLEVTNAKLGDIVGALGELEQARGNETLPILDRMHDAASGFRAAAGGGFPREMNTSLQLAAADLQAAITAARGSCAESPGPAVNEQEPQAAAWIGAGGSLSLRKRSDGRVEWVDEPSPDEPTE